MIKYKLVVFILLIVAGCLLADNVEFQQFIHEMLQQNSDYQQAVSRFYQEKALSGIDNSVNWFDINLSYQQYDNDYTRTQTLSHLEDSDVNEKDRRWRVELERQFFPKDFDNTADDINYKMNLMRYDQELQLAYFYGCSDLFDDLTDWYEAAQKIDILQKRLDILYQQNELLEELDLENLIDPETMIALLEEIEDRGDEMYDLKEVYNEHFNKYGNSLNAFFDQFQLYIQQHHAADTLQFSQNIMIHLNKLNADTRRISHSIKWRYSYLFLPEVNLTLSYNWRKTKQNWDITENSGENEMIRHQDEEYPEGKIEVSLPFNLIGNNSSKLSLLKSFEYELDYRYRELQQDWNLFRLERITFYQEAKLELKRKTRLYDLYRRDLQLQQTKFEEEPTLLGDNPTLKLNKKAIQTDEAELDMKLAEMKYYKEIFLMNCFEEETK